MSGDRKSRKRKRPKNLEKRYGIWWGRKRIKGKLHRWTLRTDDVAAASDRVKEDIARMMSAAYRRDENRVRYPDLFASWGEKYILHQVSPKSAQRYAVSLRQLEPFLLKHPDEPDRPYFVDEIDSDVIDIIINARRAQGVTTATIKRDLVALGSVFKYGRVKNNPATAALEELKEQRDPISLPEEAHIAKVVARAPGRMADLILSARKTGCRQAELVTAWHSRLDHQRQQLTVIGKRNKLRVLDLEPDAYAVLRSQPQMLGCRWLFWHQVQRYEEGGRERRAYNGVVKPGRQVLGEPYRNLSARFATLVNELFLDAYDAFHGTSTPRTGPKGKKALAELLRAEGGPDWPDIGFRTFTFHHLRHLYAVDYLRRRVGSIYDLKIQLGHSSVKTTEIYLDFLSPEDRKIAMYGTPAVQPAGATIVAMPPRGG